MQHVFYPAWFHPTEEGGYWVSFPDVPAALTEGDTMETAYEMAQEALGLCLEDCFDGKAPYPPASDLSALTPEPDAVLVMVSFSESEYRRRNSRAVKKTLSIPSWLNELAMAHEVNFSRVLQDALKQELGL